jgi:FtsP/CotA-like multicopper oxidase with cupredoxin domain
MPSGKISRRLFLGQTLASVFALPARGEVPGAQDGFRILEAREGKFKLLSEPALLTDIWGYDGTVPAPLLRFKKGEEVKVRLMNKLPQPASLSWHGVRNANSMDGVAGLTQEPVPPRGSFDYRFTPPDSGFYWYHSHVLPFFGEELARGLYGVMIVDEPEPPLADRDVLIVLSEWDLDDKGQIAPADAAWADGIKPLVTVNARTTPVEEVLLPSSRLRLRIVNACAKHIVIAFAGLAPSVLAIDSQPCEVFEPANNKIPLAPGARFDVMADLPGGPGATASLRLLGDTESDSTLAVFRTAGNQRAPLPPIASLPENPLLPAQIKLESSQRCNIIIEAIMSAGSQPAQAPAETQPAVFTINGKVFGGFASPPLFTVKRKTPVTLGFTNRTQIIQAIHVHGHAMRLLHDLDDGWEPYWRDTLLIAEGKTKHVAFVADNPGKWAIECLMTGSQRAPMASWFEVT